VPAAARCFKDLARAVLQHSRSAWAIGSGDIEVSSQEIGVMVKRGRGWPSLTAAVGEQGGRRRNDAPRRLADRLVSVARHRLISGASARAPAGPFGASASGPCRLCPSGWG
jgi:hypothetical protein